jgi:hypothetical protein
MAHYLALHDRRLMGGVPARPRLSIVNTDGKVPLHGTFAQINGVAQAIGKINSIFVLCHGYAGENTRAMVCQDAGGMGLQLGREGVFHANAALWGAIANKVDNIVIYACAAADTEAGNENTIADGRYLMGALAIYTNATVYAADRIQWYSTYKGLPNGRFDFGEWEGQLWQFPPDGGSPTKVPFAPVELADVMAGSAP